jgi:hypothetical protein
MQCPKCSENLPLGKVIALNRFRCSDCGSPLEVSGLFEASLKSVLILPIISIFDSWLVFFVGLAFYVWLFFFLFKKFVKVAVVVQ